MPGRDGHPVEGSPAYSMLESGSALVLVLVRADGRCGRLDRREKTWYRKRSATAAAMAAKRRLNLRGTMLD